MDDLIKEFVKEGKRIEYRNFKENFSLIFDHDFSGPVQHWSKNCDLCGEIYGKHVRNEILETINELEDICYCEEGKACIPHHAIDMFKRIIGEV